MQFTKTCILKSCQVEAYVVMKIVRDDAGAPRYFCCSVMPLRKTPRLCVSGSGTRSCRR